MCFSVKGRIGEWISLDIIRKKYVAAWYIGITNTNKAFYNSIHIDTPIGYVPGNIKGYAISLKDILTPKQLEDIKNIQSFDFLVIDEHEAKKLNKNLLDSISNYHTNWEIIQEYEYTKKQRDILTPAYNYNKKEDLSLCLWHQSYFNDTNEDFNRLKEKIDEAKKIVKNTKYIETEINKIKKVLIDAKFATNGKGQGEKINQTSIEWAKKNNFKIEMWIIKPKTCDLSIEKIKIN